MNIKAKATLFSTLGFAALLALVGAIAMFRMQADYQQVLGAQQFTLVREEAKEIDDKLALRLRILKAAAAYMGANGTSVREKGMENYLRRLFALVELFDDLFLFSASGHVLDNYPFSDVRQTFSMGDRDYFRETMAGKAGVISQPYLGKRDRSPSIMLTAPVLDAQGRVVAVLGGQLRLLEPNFLGTLGAAKVGKTGEFKVISRDRTIVVSHDKSRLMTPGPVPGQSSYFDRAMEGAEGWEEGFDSQGRRSLISYKQLSSVPWALVAALPVEEAYGPLASMQRRTALVGLALTALLAPLIWFGVRYLLDPLVGLRNAIRELRHATDKAVVLPEHSRDEIGDLARDFNALSRQRAEAQRALQESEARFREVTDNVAALIGYIDAEERFRYNNRTYETWLGTPLAQITGRSVRDVVGEDIYGRFGPFIRRALGGERVEFQAEFIRDGRLRGVQGTYVPHRGADGRVQGCYAFMSDITQLKEAEQRLIQAAHYDGLTGAVNRSLFLDRLAHAVARSGRTGSLIALMYLDIDRFKQVNDSLGHAAGDALLMEFSARLHRAVRKTDTVARLGGDEFVVLLENLNDRADAVRVAEKILAVMKDPHEGRPLGITTSIGVTFAPKGDKAPDELIRRADAALYEAKASGRNTYRVAA